MWATRRRPPQDSTHSAEAAFRKHGQRHGRIRDSLDSLIKPEHAVVLEKVTKSDLGTYEPTGESPFGYAVAPDRYQQYWKFAGDAPQGSLVTDY